MPRGSALEWEEVCFFRNEKLRLRYHVGQSVSSVNLFFSDETALADWLNELYVIVMEAPIP